MFLGLQDEILDGIIDVVDVEKLNGFDNVKKAVSTSKLLQISRTKLSIVVTVNDRGGICHQLANDDLIDWSRNG
jgi:hypothetical protein